MKRLILRILGWSCFVYDKVTIYQRKRLVDQTILIDVLDDTKSRRTWCDDRNLAIFIEDAPFKGIYGVEQVSEVARFNGWLFGNKSANIRVASDALSVRGLTQLIVELNRVGKR